MDDSALDRTLAGAIVAKLEGYKAIFAGNGRKRLNDFVNAATKRLQK